MYLHLYYVSKMQFSVSLCFYLLSLFLCLNGNSTVTFQKKCLCESKAGVILEVPS